MSVSIQNALLWISDRLSYRLFQISLISYVYFAFLDQPLKRLLEDENEILDETDLPQWSKHNLNL